MSGKSSSLRSTRTSPASGTPTTGTPPLATQIAALGLVRDTVEAKLYLQQRALIAINNNFTTETLTNILFSITLDYKLPENVASTIKAVGFLIREQTHNLTISNLSSAISAKILDSTNSISKEIERDRDFLKATAAEQALLTKQLTDMVTLMTTSTQVIDTSTQTLLTSIKDLKPAIQGITSTKDSLESLANTIASLTKNVEDLRTSCPSHTDSTVTSHTNPNLPSNQISYANITASNSNAAGTIVTPPNNPEYANFIQRITNRLNIAAKQHHITYNPTDTKAPKEKNSLVAQQLRVKLNNMLKDLETNPTQNNDKRPTAIRALQLLERNAILLEFDTQTGAAEFQTLCDTQDILSTYICPSARLQTRAYRIILRFVPCDGDFDPTNRSCISQIETNLNLAENSIIQWGTKPFQCFLLLERITCII